MTRPTRLSEEREKEIRERTDMWDAFTGDLLRELDRLREDAFCEIQKLRVELATRTLTANIQDIAIERDALRAENQLLKRVADAAQAQVDRWYRDSPTPEGG